MKNTANWKGSAIRASHKLPERLAFTSRRPLTPCEDSRAFTDKVEMYFQRGAVVRATDQRTQHRGDEVEGS